LEKQRSLSAVGIVAYIDRFAACMTISHSSMYEADAAIQVWRSPTCAWYASVFNDFPSPRQRRRPPSLLDWLGVLCKASCRYRVAKRWRDDVTSSACPASYDINHSLTSTRASQVK